MRFFFVGELFEGSTTLDRMRWLRRLGHEVIPFDTSPYRRGGCRLERSLAWRFNLGRPVRRMNLDLLRAAEAASDATHLWIEKGVWVRRSTLLRLKERIGAPAVHYTPDPAILLHRSRHFTASIPHYDVLFTTKSAEVELYRRLGGRRVILTHQSYDPERFFPRPTDPARSADVTFVGHREGHYDRCLRAVAAEEVALKVWGPGWDGGLLRPAWRNGRVQGGALWGADYPAALASAKICLGLLSKRYPDTTTTRTFEIPACGAFLLAERTKEHTDLFEPGREADFFSSPGELVEKVRYYLAHEDERRRIAAAGRERCLRSGYSTEHRMREMLECVAGPDRGGAP